MGVNLMTSLFRPRMIRRSSGEAISVRCAPGGETFGGVDVNEDKRVLLSGVVTSVSTVGCPSDKREHVTFAVDGAEPLWAEFRVPNNHGWTVGDKVAISVVHVERRSTVEAT